MYNFIVIIKKCTLHTFTHLLNKATPSHTETERKENYSKESRYFRPQKYYARYTVLSTARNINLYLLLNDVATALISKLHDKYYKR